MSRISANIVRIARIGMLAPRDRTGVVSKRRRLAAWGVAVVALMLSIQSALAAVQPSPAPTGAVREGRATRVAIPGLGVDLPVVSEKDAVEGNEPGYPLCDVAQYLENFADPGRPGTTYIYAHARNGMFAPLLAASLVEDGRSLVGLDAHVYTNDAQLHSYRIFLVKRHATDFSIAEDVPPGEQRLVLQTSEGPRGTIPVLQVAARLVSTVRVDLASALPVARPSVCQDPLPPLVPKRFLAAAGAGLVAVVAAAWWLRNRRRRGPRALDAPPVKAERWGR